MIDCQSRKCGDDPVAIKKFEQDQKEFEEWIEECQRKYDMQFKRNGMVAFFDILGYRQMATHLAENTLRDVMMTVETVTEKAKSTLSEEDGRGDGGRYGTLFTSRFDDIESTVISDSMIFHQRFSENHEPQSQGITNEDFGLLRKFEALNFIRFCRRIFSDLMGAKLPIRGALAAGEYYWNKKAMFAGRSLIEAHDLSERLNCAGVVLCESMTCEVDEALKKGRWPELIRGIAGPMDVPVKAEEQKPLYVLCPDQWLAQDGRNIETWHREVFTKHGGCLRGAVLTKFNNTNALMQNAVKSLIQ